jgi:hypothetical protein
MWRESGVNPGNPSGGGGAGLQLVGGENAEHWEDLKSIIGAPVGVRIDGTAEYFTETPKCSIISSTSL